MKFTKYQAWGEYRMNKRLFAMMLGLLVNSTTGIKLELELEPLPF
jgi:hypothetical protein